METVLTIAGSDTIGGAGIQADIKTITCNGSYAMSVITAMTAQNTLGVQAIQESSTDFLIAQLDAVFSDIFPDAIKIGMVSNSKLIEIIAEKLKYYKAKNIVIDPVMVATSGSKLINTTAVKTLTSKLFPLATVITPNIPEAEILSNMQINSDEQMGLAAKKISDEYNCSVLLKGGHNKNNANDLLYIKENFLWFISERINNENNHGTGCSLSSAIASYLAKGETLECAVQLAKNFITECLKANLNLGKGSGPIMHNYKLIKK